jgi:hypothetical protein
MLKNNVVAQEREKQQISYLEYNKGPKMATTRPSNTASNRKRHGKEPPRNRLKSRVDLMVGDAIPPPPNQSIARKHVPRKKCPAREKTVC